MSNCCANSASVLSPRTAAKATFALKAGVWFRRGRLVIVSPGLQPFWLLSGRNSTYPDVHISWASSIGPLPDDTAARSTGRQIQAMLEKPQQRLTDAAEFGELREDQCDRLLDATVGILFQAMAIGFDVSDRDGDKQLAAARHLLACGQRALAQQVEFVFVQAAFQAKQESIIALARGIDGLLIDEQSIDDAAHLDQLLPVPAVAGETRDLARCHGPNLAEADVGHHPLKAGA